jgi:signal transduction histidine kinase
MKPLLSHLRVRLLLLYLIVGAILALGISAGAYTLINYYFRASNDAALRLKMGLEFATFRLPMPIELYKSLDQADLISQGSDVDSLNSSSINEQATENPNNQTTNSYIPSISVDSVEISEIADIVAIPLTIEGTPITGTIVTNSWLPVNKDAIASAINNGSDYRTIKLSDGTPVRLLTYRVPIKNEIGVIQVARSLKNQQHLLSELVNGILIIAGIFLVFLGLMSWWIAGRSIKPTQLAWERQQTFVANASHELRTPLTLIHAGVEIAQRQSESPKQKQLLQDVLDDANYMTKLIENLLLLSRLDSHKLPLEPQNIELNTFFEEIVRKNNRASVEKDVSILYDKQDISVYADPVRLKQTLLIFIDNAIRSTPPHGFVKLSASKNLSKVWIEVSDNGIGIPEDQLKKIFDRFYKVNDRSTQDYRGSGLGLSIAKGLIEAQSGEIQISSVIQQGTQVRFSLPTPK